MSATINFPFTTPANYSYDSDKIEVTGGVAKLKLPIEQNDFTEDFADDTDFIYDSDATEFTGGQMRQIDKTPANGIFYSSYTNDINGSWGNGTLTATVGGSANVHDGLLDLTGGNAYVEYPVNNFSSMTQQGCIRMKVKFGYTGDAPAIQYILQSASTAASRVYFVHNAGFIQIYISNNAGALIFSITKAWTPTAGVTYEFEINFNATSGSANFYINGTRIDTASGTGTRGAPNLWRVGQSSNANIQILDMLVFDTVQHTAASYSPDWSDIYETKYLADVITTPEMEHTNPGTLILFDTFSTTDTNTPRYTLQIGRSGDYLYWNGSAWAVSDGSYAQSTDEATFNTNCGDLPVDGEIYGQFKIHFQSSNNQQSVSELTATLTENGSYATDNPIIQTNATFKANILTDFQTTETVAGSDAIKYIIDAGGQDRYVTGGSASDSNGTYAQSSTEAEIQSDIENIITARKTISIKVFLHSDDGSTTPEVDLVSLIYNAAIDDQLLTLIELEGFIYDQDGPIADEVVKIRPYQGFLNGNVLHKYAFETFGTTDANGHVYGNVYLQATGQYWELKVGSQRYKFSLPAQLEVSFSELSTFEVIEDD